VAASLPATGTLPGSWSGAEFAVTNRRKLCPTLRRNCPSYKDTFDKTAAKLNESLGDRSPNPTVQSSVKLS